MPPGKPYCGRSVTRSVEWAATLDVDGISRAEDFDGFDERVAAVCQTKNTSTVCCGNIVDIKFYRGTSNNVETEYNGFRVLIPSSTVFYNRGINANVALRIIPGEACSFLFARFRRWGKGEYATNNKRPWLASTSEISSGAR